MTRLDTSELLNDRYRLLRPIAAGGMGSVWEAHDELLDRRVAVKVLSDALAADPRFVERFRREARAAGRLSHPNLARVYDFGDDGRRHFLVMELVDGETLHERIARDAPLPAAEAVRIAGTVADALEVAHRAGVIHRDVKPANVMLDRHGAVKVMDFGIAAAAWRAPITTTGATLGTARYASPEQAAGAKVTAASDVYSLAVVTYEMLTGQPPFEADSPLAVALAHVREQPPPIGELAPRVPRPVAIAVERALAKDPLARPSSASAFAAALRNALTAPGSTQPLAPPTRPLPVPSATRRGRRAARWIVALSALAIGAAMVGIVLSRPGSGPALPTSTPSPAPTTTPTTVLVPGVVGLQRADAIRELAAAGLNPGNVIIVRADAEPGSVVGTDPPGGSSVQPGTSVTLYVEAPRHGKGKGND